MRIDKEMSTDECIEHAKKLKDKLGLNVLIIDNKVKEVSTLQIEEDCICGDYIIVDGLIHYIGDEK